MNTPESITHIRLDMRRAAERRALQMQVPSYRREERSRALLLSMLGVPQYGGDVHSYRVVRRDRSDPLQNHILTRVRERGFQLLAKLGKDRPGEMITFEIEAFLQPYRKAELRDKLPLAVQLVSDGSLDSSASSRTRGMEGIELRVPCSITDYSRLYRVCALLASLGARVNTSCGLHVHLDVRDLSPSKRYEQVKAEGNRLYSVLAVVGRYLVPPSRTANRYCAILPPSTRDRYRIVNAEATSKHGTIECRLHSGTIEPDKARLWAEFCLFFLRRPLSKSQKTTLAAVYDPAAALDWLLKSDLPPTLKWWSAQRLEKFHPSAVRLPSAGSNASEASE